MIQAVRFAVTLALALIFQAPPAPAAPPTADQALWAAVRHNDPAAVASALAAGANPRTVNIDFEPHYNSSMAVITQAAINGNPAIVGMLLDKGADVNARDSAGYTPLLNLNPHAPAAVVQKMLDAGADVNAVGLNRVPALSYFSIFGRTDIARLLLAHGATVDARGVENSTALMLAAGTGHLDLVKLLIAHGANVYAKSDHFGTALTVAACDSDGNATVLAFLLHRGLDINQRQMDWGSPLQGAALFGRVENVKFLLAHGANVNTRDDSGKTTLDYARQGKTESGQAPARFDKIMALLRAAGEKH